VRRSWLGTSSYMSIKNKRSDESIVQAARISAKSAAIVALITTIGGAFAGYFLRPNEGNNNKANNKAIAQNTPIAQLHWIKIERIESGEFMDVRILATVNGVRFSYPSSTIWQEVGPNRSAAIERFLIPPVEGTYRVSFYAFVNEYSRNKPGEATSSHVDEIDVSKLPTNVLSYDLYGSVRPMTRGGEPAGAKAIRVFYSIE
jgi:hypothetical protein